MNFMWFSYIASTRCHACPWLPGTPPWCPLAPRTQMHFVWWSLAALVRFGMSAPKADVLAAESWMAPAKSMSLAVSRKRPFTSNFDNRDTRLLPATHRSTWVGHFPWFLYDRISRFHPRNPRAPRSPSVFFLKSAGRLLLMLMCIAPATATGLLHAYGSWQRWCEQPASHNTQILA